MALMGARASLAQSVLRLKKAYQPGERILFLTERSGDVIENKGSAFQGRWQSRNVVENTGIYALKAGMLLKIQVVSRWGKNRIQDAGFRK